MSKAYIEWIDQEINRHQTEIARLTVARGVIEEASNTFTGRGKVVLTGKHATKQVDKKKRTQGSTRDHIVAALRELGQPSLPGTITATIRARYPDVTRKAIANALYNARQVNDIARTADGLYALPEMLKTVSSDLIENAA